MKKLLLSLVLVSAVSANAFAMDIKNGKLLSHKEWSKGSITGTFNDVTGKNAKSDRMQQLLAKERGFTGSLGNLDSSDSIFLVDDMRDTQGYVDEALNIVGTSQIFITNGSTDLSHTYTITNAIGTCYASPSMPLCFDDAVISQDVIQLHPQGSIDVALMPRVSKMYSEAGHGWAWQTTTVQRDGVPIDYKTSAAAEFEIYPVNNVKK